MKKISRLLMLMMASMLILAACSKDDKEEGNSSNEASEKRKLVVSSFGGDYEAAQMEVLVKPFEEEFNAEVEVVTLYSADALARIKAQKGSPEIDVVQFSGGQEIQAINEELVEEIDSSIVKNISGIYESAVLEEGYGPAMAFDALGILYNIDLVKDVPTSWKDLWKEEYKGNVGVIDISNTFGLQFLVMNALLNEGNEDNIDPGFSSIETLLPHASSIVGTTPDLGNLFAQEEVVIAPYDSGYAFNFSKQGQPIGFSIPEEGGMAIFINMQVVKGTKNSELANEFINYSLRPEVQKAFAEKTGFSPTNKDVKISVDLAEVIPHGEEVMDSLIKLDWNTINENKAEWTERWSKLISQ
ncbi:ABC transporter substrate-binding protein [Sporosarcina obsidiansis]|uniref:ABC transporter substrate-binding protein n=1 Tax=Sporosarcina obsidiansis TaxID=2660748 RepID=UPI00129AF5EE|nr:ABC transporter substrate-binding protein [Sporosarcina obsidiansis]